MALIEVLLYIIIAATPLLIASVGKPFTNNPFLMEMGRGAALVAFMILMLQPILAGRFRWIERSFGLDLLIRFHRNAAVIGAGLIIAHPLLLTSGEHGIDVIIGTNVPWPVYLGRGALFLLLINVFFSLYRLPRGMKFEKWRTHHDILGPVILLLVFVHSFFQGHDLKDIAPLRGLWISVFGLAVIAFFYHRVVRPFRLGRRPYRVSDVIQETEDVWTVKLRPSEGDSLYQYQPGQFHFLTFVRANDDHIEEHHWTISSSPTEKSFVSSTIKELGDFTSTIGKTQRDDRAIVHAPFGRFSYTFHPDEKDLVFIAGGIGITPLRSMLIHMRDTRSIQNVLLLYANKRREDIVFYDELADIEKGQHPRLRVVHVLSEPPEGWTGEAGFIDDQIINKYCGSNNPDTGYYLCGPPGLLSSSIENLKSRGVRDKRIHMEIFSFLS